ncbi:MAG: hypothetical protein ABL890_04045 [Candidatus Peribacteraceae bacterium]
MSKKHPHSTQSFATYALAVMAVTITVAGAVSVDAMATAETTDSSTATQTVRPARRMFDLPRAAVLDGSSETGTTDTATVDMSTRSAVSRLIRSTRQESRQNTRTRVQERRSENRVRSTVPSSDAETQSAQGTRQPLGQMLRTQIENGSCSSELPARVAKLCELMLQAKQARDAAKSGASAETTVVE